MNVRPDFNIIRLMAEEIRAALGDDFDADAFLDTLDGETDAADIADRLIAELADAEAMAEAIKAQEADLRSRRGRYEMRGDAFRRQAQVHRYCDAAEALDRQVADDVLRAAR